MATGSQNNTSYQAQKWTNLRAFTIGETAKNVDGTSAISWSKDEILGTSTDAYFLRGDKAWSQSLSANLTVGQYAVNTDYILYINGTSYFNGDTTHNGYDYFADGTTYYINNNGTANLYGLTTNYDTIIKGLFTINNHEDHPLIYFQGSNNTQIWGYLGMARSTLVVPVVEEEGSEEGEENEEQENEVSVDLYSNHRFKFLNYSYSSNNNSRLFYYESFELPTVNADRENSETYLIITEKSLISGKYQYGEHDANNTTLNGLYYYTSNGPSTQLGALSADGGLYVQVCNSSWQGQIAQDYHDGSLYMRGKNNDTWTKWLQAMQVDLASTTLTNCNNVYKTGIYTKNGFTNKPSSVTDWGTLINYKLYESNNKYHRQIFLDCYDTDKIWTRSCSNDTWTSWKMLLTTNSGDPRYHVGSTSSTSYVLVTINKETSWMLNFTLKLYQSYTATDIQISGYNYGSNHWYSPQAVILGSTTTGAIKIYFGYTGNYKLWVAVDGGNYNGAAVVNFCNGYTQIDLDDAITVTKVSSLPGTTQTTVTAYRPFNRAETIPIANGGTGATSAAGARYNLSVPAMSLSTSYPKLMAINSSGTAVDNWIMIGSTTTYGILPGASGGAGSGHCYIGTSSWYWAYAYIDNIYGTLNGNATSATKATQDGSGNTITSYYCTLSTDQTITGKKTFHKQIIAYAYKESSSRPFIVFDKPGSYWAGIGPDGTANRIKFGPNGGSGTDWTAQSTFNSNNWYFQGTLTCTSTGSFSDTLYAPNFGTDATMTIHPSNSNELNFGGSNTSKTIYFGYRAWGSRPQPTEFIFGSGSTGSANIKCAHLYIRWGYGLYSRHVCGDGVSSDHSLYLNYAQNAGIFFGNSGAYAMNAAGSYYSGTCAGVSLRATKTNFREFTDEEAKRILDINILKFDYKPNFHKGEKNQIGAIIDEVEPLIPSVIFTDEGYDESKFDENIPEINQPLRRIEYDKFVPFLIRLAQIQDRRITELETRLKQYEI